MYFLQRVLTVKDIRSVKCHLVYKLQFLSDNRSNLKILTVTCNPDSFSSKEVNINNNYSKCHVTSNKVTSKLECAEGKFQTREWVRETPPTTSYARDLTRNAGPCSKLRYTCCNFEQGHE
jgi:hypothetical protein